MKRQSNNNPPPEPDITGPLPMVSSRLPRPLHDRFCLVVKVSKRSKTSILEECLEAKLPELEKQYAAMAKAA